MESLRNDLLSVAFVYADRRHSEEAERMIQAVSDTMGRLDIAVNCAAIGAEIAPTDSNSIAAWQQIIDLNLSGVFYAMHYEIPLIAASGGGAIVNMTSIPGSVGRINVEAYSAAKHGVVGLTKAAALEYAAQGVRVNAVGPGYLEPERFSELDEEARQQVIDLNLAGRQGSLQDAADLVAFLCSDAAADITGEFHALGDFERTPSIPRFLPLFYRIYPSCI